MNIKFESNTDEVFPAIEKFFSNLLNNNKFIYAILGVTMLFVFAARMHLLTFPFERDEGEFAYMGKLILDGHPPYILAYNMKLPGTYYMYAIFMGIFGESITGVHMGLALISIASMYLMFLISRTYISKIGAIISTASFGIIGTSRTLLGQSAHATHFVVFFSLLGICMILPLHKTRRGKLFQYFISGSAFSLAFICKQPGIFFMLFGLTFIVIREYNIRSLFDLIKSISSYLSGFAVPVIMMLLYFYFFADFGKFWYWTVEQLSRYGSEVPISQAPFNFKMSVRAMTADYSSIGYIGLWLISLLGIPIVFINNFSIKNKMIILSFLLFSFLTIVPGFYFREHYFITLLPAIALLIAFFFEYFINLFINKFEAPYLKYLCLLAFILTLVDGIDANTDYLFKQDPLISCKKLFGSNPFVESIKIGGFLKQNTTKDDKIAVLGSEAQIYFYADRYSASGYIYMYNLVEVHPYALSMQKEMAHEIETNKPKYIVFVKINMSWLTRPNSEAYIFNWINEYINNNYSLVGLCDVLPHGFSSFKVGDELKNYLPKSQDIIYIYEKNL